ncbi:hypothetical protein, partial [Streptomyces afghaniensis]|uniref:hypothetical protein n=1 Tax=Streptomyces afghaniensis TaxID=66865 RepID=UPI002468D857
INVCNNSFNEFQSIQWNLALAKICLDPLLIIFEETNTEKLTNQILAKPLISGIITEIITIIKSTNIKLNSDFDNGDK